MEQSLQCSSRENENDQNVWFNFSSTYQQQQQPNEQQQLSALYSSIQSPASYGVLQGISAGSNTNYYNNNLFSSSLRNNNNNNHNSSSTSTLDLLSSSSFSSTLGYNLHAVDRHHHLDFLSTPNYNSSAFNKNRALFGYAHPQQQHHHHQVQDSINNNNSPSNSSNKVCIFSSSYTHFLLLISSHLFNHFTLLLIWNKKYFIFTCKLLPFFKIRFICRLHHQVLLEQRGQ